MIMIMTTIWKMKQQLYLETMMMGYKKLKSQPGIITKQKNYDHNDEEEEELSTKKC